MKLTLPLLSAALYLFSPVWAASGKTRFDIGLIFEYEDSAQLDHQGLLSAVKSTLTNKLTHVDEIAVERRIEFSTSLFRGISANISGVGEGVTAGLLKGALQELDNVKSVTPIEISNSKPGTVQRGNAIAHDHPSNLGSRELQSSMKRAQNAPDGHIMTGVDKVHAEGNKGKGVKIAVMGDGFDYKQEVFGNSIGPVTGVKGPAVEDNDPYSDCTLEGTPSFGIMGANPTRFGVVGTAPEASYELHRITGCAGLVASDLFIKAAIGIHERGVDIITTTLGFYLQYPDSALSSVVSRINQNGTYFQLAASNKGSKLYTGQSPAAGTDNTAVGSVYNTETPIYTWGGKYTTKGKVVQIRVGVTNSMIFPTSFKIWTASTQASDRINTGCLPLPANLPLPDFNTTAVLITQLPGDECDVFEAQKNYIALGARYILFYPTTPETPVTGFTPYFGFSGIKGTTNLLSAQGAALFAAYHQDKDLDVSIETSADHNDTVTYLSNNISGGRMAAYTSWGPTADGRTYPTFSAPGGQVLTTFVRKFGGFLVFYGTSVATSFNAGVAALVKARHPDFDGLTIRNILSTTSNPMPFNDNSTKAYGFLAPVFQQGGGLVDAYRAVHTNTIVDTPNLSFNDTTHSPYQPKTLSFKVKNIGTKAQSYKAYHIGAVSGHGIAQDPYSAAGKDDLIKGFVASYAGVSISPSSFTLAPGSQSTISVTVDSLPAGLDPKRLPYYGGYISLNATDATQTVTVPYTGIATNLKTSIGIDPEAALASYLTGTSERTAPPAGSPPVYNVTYQGAGKTFADGALPSTTYRINAAALVRTYEIALVKSNGDLFLNLLSASNDYSGENYWWLDGSDENYTFIPAGEYRWRIRALKIYGDANNVNDWVSHVSDPWVLKYTPESVGLPGGGK
ncbi:uncharacterized protein RSE6_01583 [Rhynchosporium secalis]|uniref:Subtilisin-like serine protease n=1 Tax=Rhynchosporium secalis TaxID=38038 RepID=A0A1E1LY46_RHYSE|nr:uncharacterized protein RSE6_01583 [Rhynchosporium secalis]